MGIPPRDAKIQSQIGSEKLASFLYQPAETDGKRPKGTGGYKTSYNPVLKPEVLNGPMELIKGKPFAVERSH